MTVNQKLQTNSGLCIWKRCDPSAALSLLMNLLAIGIDACIIETTGQIPCFDNYACTRQGVRHVDRSPFKRISGKQLA